MRFSAWCLLLVGLVSCGEAARIIVYPGTDREHTIIKAFDEHAARVAALKAARGLDALQAADAKQEGPLFAGDWMKSRSIDIRLDFKAADLHYTRTLPLQKAVLGKNIQLEYNLVQCRQAGSKGL